MPEYGKILSKNPPRRSPPAREVSLFWSTILYVGFVTSVAAAIVWGAISQ